LKNGGRLRPPGNGFEVAAYRRCVDRPDARTSRKETARIQADDAVPALAAHAMIPVALEEAGSLAVLPTVAGLPFALYLALAESFV
jgi:hypothetical protein